MEPRIDGKLKTWNEDKGFGFITPLNGGQDVFVHISSYPRRGGKPVVGEALSFEVTLNADQKKKAVNVQRPGQLHGKSASPRRPNSSRRRGGSFLGAVASIAFIGVLIFFRVPGADAPIQRDNFSGHNYCSGHWGRDCPESIFATADAIAPR